MQLEDKSLSPNSIGPDIVKIEVAGIDDFLGKEESIDRAIN